MKRKKTLTLLTSAIFFTSLIIVAATSREIADTSSANDLFRQAVQGEQPLVLTDEKQKSSGRSDSILDLLVDDDDLQRQQQELAEIWLSYLDEYERTNKSAERILAEEEQKKIMLAKDQGEAIEATITVLPPVVPEDYTGHYLGREKFTIVLSSFDNLAFYQSLFDDLTLVDFKLVEYSYSELFAASQHLMEAIPNSTASVNSVLGRITLEVAADIDAHSRALIFKSVEIDSKLYDYIDIEEVQPVQVLASEIWAGDRIGVGNINFTAGATGLYQGTNTLFSSGHGTSVGQVVMYRPFPAGASVSTIGSIKISRFYQGAVGDFSFTTLNTNAVPTNLCFTDGSTYATIPIKASRTVALNVGDTVWKYGSNSQRTRYVVSEVNVPVTYQMTSTSTITINGLTALKVVRGPNAVEGDSGGPVYYESNGIATLAGFISGGGGSITYITPIDTINNYYSFSIKTN